MLVTAVDIIMHRKTLLPISWYLSFDRLLRSPQEEWEWYYSDAGHHTANLDTRAKKWKYKFK